MELSILEHGGMQLMVCVRHFQFRTEPFSLLELFLSVLPLPHSCKVTMCENKVEGARNQSEAGESVERTL